MYRTVFSTLVVLALGTSLAMSQRGEGHRRMRPFHEKRESLIEKLNLTEDQESTMQKLRLDLEKKQTQTHSKVQMTRLELKELLLADKVDRAAMEKSIKSVSDLQHQLKMNWLNHWFAVREILSPEQQEVWKEHFGAMGRGMPFGRHEMRGMIRREPEDE